MANSVFIVASARTPIGSLNGVLSPLTAPQLGAIVIRALLQRSGIEPGQINELYMGNVVSAGVGQAPAQQASIYAGLPTSIPCTTVNKVCASGMKAIMLGAQSIASGENEIVIAGGMESMSNIPHYLEKSRTGLRLGHGQLTDGILKDGLWDPYNDYHMGEAGEICSAEYGITREDQDRYAAESYRRTIKAYEQGLFREELVSVEISGKKPVLVTEDEEFRKADFEKMPKLKPVFRKDGSITAANASKINDGAAGVILVGEKKMKELGLKPLARIVAFADASQAPEWFTTTPIKAMGETLSKAGLTAQQMDAVEINEAFSCVPIVNAKELGIAQDKLNLWGGAVSIGHPIGCSGARIIVTLGSVLKHLKGR
ncbi:MAG TPA: acetyl-CoA C-acyltransferase, partial [Flavitalea sp.]|nr:acetyl-CoA C-acyltransferase [Flavitalea sp.]